MIFRVPTSAVVGGWTQYLPNRHPERVCTNLFARFQPEQAMGFMPHMVATKLAYLPPNNTGSALLKQPLFATS